MGIKRSCKDTGYVTIKGTYYVTKYLWTRARQENREVERDRKRREEKLTSCFQFESCNQFPELPILLTKLQVVKLKLETSWLMKSSDVNVFPEHYFKIITVFPTSITLQYIVTWLEVRARYICFYFTNLYIPRMFNSPRRWSPGTLFYGGCIKEFIDWNFRKVVALMNFPLDLQLSS